MGTNSSHFVQRPRTKLGWWSVGLGALFTLLFIGKHERSWLVMLTLLPGLWVVFMLAGEFLFPH